MTLQILFVAVLGPDFQSDIAIDTLSIKQGNCSSKKNKNNLFVQLHWKK